jgi:hypothetical protein
MTGAVKVTWAYNLLRLYSEKGDEKEHVRLDGIRY